MDHNFYILRLEVKEPAGFSHFESLVHQRCGIDRDALAHLPGWMIEGLGRRHMFEIDLGGIPKWSPRSRQNQFRNFLPKTGPKALMCSVMFTVDRDQLGSRCPLGIDDN